MEGCSTGVLLCSVAAVREKEQEGGRREEKKEKRKEEGKENKKGKNFKLGNF
jgi:hypothetical protein